jgi:Arc/MetJ family transcription regulator
MRTTLDVPEDLMNEAQRLLQFKSKTDTVIYSLRELIRGKRMEELKEMAGATRRTDYVSAEGIRVMPAAVYLKALI